MTSMTKLIVLACALRGSMLGMGCGRAGVGSQCNNHDGACNVEPECEDGLSCNGNTGSCEEVPPNGFSDDNGLSPSDPGGDSDPAGSDSDHDGGSCTVFASVVCGANEVEIECNNAPVPCGYDCSVLSEVGTAITYCCAPVVCEADLDAGDASLDVEDADVDADN